MPADKSTNTLTKKDSPIDNNLTVTPRMANIAFALGTLFFAYAFIQRVAPSIMTNELMRDFSVGGGALGSLSSFYFWTYAAIQLPVGMLTDRFGPRKLMSIAVALCFIASIGFGMSESVFAASFWRALIGGSVAFAFVGTMAIAGYWFNHSRHAMLAGVLQAVGMLGAIFAQAPLRPIVENWGWRNTMYGLAVVALVLSVLIYLLIPKRSGQQKHSGPAPRVTAGLSQVCRNPQSWLCAFIGFGMCATMLAFAGLWAVPWLHTVHDYTITQAGLMASTFFLGWAVFSPFVGHLSDRIGKRNPIIRTGSACYLLLFSVVVFFTPTTPIGLVILFFASGAFGSAMTVCFVVVKENNDPANGSTAMGLMNMFVVGSGAVMQPTIGWILDRNWDGALDRGARIYDAAAYTGAFTSLIFLIGVALACSLVLRETNCRHVTV